MTLHARKIGKKSVRLLRNPTGTAEPPATLDSLDSSPQAVPAKRHRHRHRALFPVQAEATSVVDFCKAHGISKALFYVLRKIGDGPDVMRVRGRTLISREAAAAWRRKMEGPVAGAATESAPSKQGFQSSQSKRRPGAEGAHR